MSDNPTANKHEIGKRLTRVRKMTGLSRREVEGLYAISSATLQTWEQGIHGGLTSKGADRILTMLQAEGIACSKTWLLEGIGLGPRWIGDQPDLQSDDAQCITRELELFKMHHPNALDFVVPNDCMQPRFVTGESVAGLLLHDDKIQQAVNQDCIVILKNGEILLRYLKQGSQSNRFSLFCSNLQTSEPKPVLYDTELTAAAVVIWQRRPANDI